MKSIEALRIPHAKEELAYVMSAIELVVKELAGRVPLIGFAGSPWTLATYMVEGGSSKNFHSIKRFLFTQPAALQLLLDKLTAAVSDYLQAQIDSGVQAVMIFDTWGGLLTPADYQQFSLQPMQRIIAQVKQHSPHLPVIIFTKNGSQWLAEMAESGADALGIDWTISLRDARLKVQNKVALQGNMDPAILYASPERIRQEVKKILQSYGKGPGHIFNLGHGIHPDTPPESVQFLVDIVHELSQSFHQDT